METVFPYDTILKAEAVAVLGLALVIVLIVLLKQQSQHNRNNQSLMTILQKQTDNHTRQIDSMNTTNRLIGELEHRIEKETGLLIAHDEGAINRQGVIVSKLTDIHTIVSSIKTAVDMVETYIKSIEKDANK